MKVLVIDIETTGLDPHYDLIVEIAAVLLNTKTGRIKTKFNSLIKEDGEINKNAWIFKNSNLRYEEVIEKGRSINNIRNKLQKLINKFSSTSYNKSFDFRFLRARGFDFKSTISDPMLVMTDVLQIVTRYENYKWPRVQEVIDYFGWGIVEAHRALEDAKIEAKIIYEAIKRGYFDISAEGVR